MKQWFIIASLILMLTACNLKDEGESISLPATDLPEMSLNCQLRPDWFTYTVIAGDTLSSIATNSGSTVSLLVEGNCLANPNSITPGQQLLVPRLPSDPNTVNQTLTISPIVENRNGTSILQPGTTVNIIWAGVPEGSLVVFTEHNFLIDGGVSIIAEMTLASSGANMTYVVPDEINGQITAGARLPGQNHETLESDPLLIQTVGYGDGDCYYVAPALGLPPVVYSGADTSSPVLGEAAQDIEYRVVALVDGLNKGSTAEFLQIIYGDQTGYLLENNIPLRGDCSNL